MTHRDAIPPPPRLPTFGRPQPDSDEPAPTLRELAARMANVEKVVLQLQAMMTPKWVRYAGWGTLIGACIKELLSA